MISQYYDPPNPGDTLRQTYFVEYSPSGSYDYNLNTPYRIQGSVAFIIGNVGLVSADYEFADYAQAKLDAPDYSFSDENLATSNSYAAGHNIRLGTEWRYNIFSFRAGGKYFTSPYQNDINDGSKWGVSAGVGLRKGWFFMDIAYAYTHMEEDYYFYSSPSIVPNPVLNTLKSSYILTTFGIKL
jgi:hypothetical protein